MNKESQQFDVELLQALLNDSTFSKANRKLATIFSIITIIFIVIVVFGVTLFSVTIKDMYNTYIKNTEEIIRTKSDINLANAWERLPESQRKERLREQYYQLVRYYTEMVPSEQKMNDDLINASFNELWNCTSRVQSINFFLPVAYIKVATNFNPVHNNDYKYGIAAFYDKMGERICNLPLIKEDPFFRIVYRGRSTLNNPNEAIRLLIARIDDLMTTFMNREDWVILSLFTNEYDVISQYWDNGNGKIPEKFYTEGNLAETIKYYYSFKNWQIPAIVNKK